MKAMVTLRVGYKKRSSLSHLAIGSKQKGIINA